MDSLKIWNKIVEHYKNKYNEKEEVLQKDWEIILSDLFNYSKFFGEIDAHRQLKIGSTKTVIPDIIIKNDDVDLFDVELKQYNLQFSVEMENQLKSYLDLLHLSVGILICQKIYLYIYDFGQSKFKRTEIDIVENNPDGAIFVDLFKKGAFSKEKVEDFIDSKKSFATHVAKIKEEVTCDLINELLKKHFDSIYSETEINEALSGTEISISAHSVSPVMPVTESVTAKKVVAFDDDYNIYSEPSFDYVIIKTSEHRVNECKGDLYEATRFAWKAGPRIEKYRYVISVINKIVKEVYLVSKWDTVKSGDLMGRYEFVGSIATLDEARKLIGKTIPYEYRKTGMASPVIYKKVKKDASYEASFYFIVFQVVILCIYSLFYQAFRARFQGCKRHFLYCGYRSRWRKAYRFLRLCLSCCYRDMDLFYIHGR